MIGIGGGILGVAGAQLLIGALPAILPADFPRLSDITLDWRVPWRPPRRRWPRSPPARWCRRCRRGVSNSCSRWPRTASRRSAAAHERGSRLRAAIMAGQVAIACILLIGAVLLGRSLQALIDIDRGYDPSNLLTARLPLPSGPTYGATSGPLLQGIRDRLQALPGVTHASFGNALPLVSAGGMSGLNVRLPRDPSTVAKVQTLHRTVDPAAFRRDGIAAASRPPADRQRQRDLTARARGEQVVRGSVSRRRSDRTASPALLTVTPSGRSSAWSTT